MIQLQRRLNEIQQEQKTIENTINETKKYITIGWVVVAVITFMGFFLISIGIVIYLFASLYKRQNASRAQLECLEKEKSTILNKIKEQELRIQQAQNAASENVDLENQLELCQVQQKNIQRQLDDEKTLFDFVSAHITLFSSMGIANLQFVFDSQKQLVQAKQNELEKCHKHSRELQDRIARNKRIISAGH